MCSTCPTCGSFVLIQERLEPFITFDEEIPIMMKNDDLLIPFKLKEEKEEEPKKMQLRKRSRDAIEKLAYLASVEEDDLVSSGLFTRKRDQGPLSKDASSFMIEWFHAHITWPYGSTAEYDRMSKVTGLTRVQIRDWLTNQRSRHWMKAFGNVIPVCKDGVELFLITKFGSLENGIAQLIAL